MARIKFNPIARAVAVIASVAALATGVTFAALQSNTVSLSPNTLSAASATLAIGALNTCPTGNTTETPGFTNVKLVPGEASDPVAFCLDNTGDVPLTMFTRIPTDLTGSSMASQVTLDIDCGDVGTVSGTLSALASYQQFSGDPLGTADPVNCTATATLEESFSGTGSVPSFSIDFIGNQATEPV